MEQRPPRLGDLVDDYCPRERRVTNHAIVAIVNDGIRQTRCTTCEVEHLYKAGKAPRRRKKDSPTEFEDQVIDNTGGQLVTPFVEVEAPADTPAHGEPIEMSTDASPDAAADTEAVDERRDDGWPAHRPLIRATLPKTEGDLPPPRPIPEFTMHQRHNSRGGSQPFRYGRGWHDRGAGQSRDGSRGDGRSASGQGPGHGNGGPGQGHGQPRRHGKKRSR